MPNPIRDPDGQLEHFQYLLATLPSREALQQRLATLPAASIFHPMAAQLRYTQTALRYQYGMGMPLVELRGRVIEGTDSLVQDAAFIRNNGGGGFTYMWPVDATDRQAYSTVALALLLTKDVIAIDAGDDAWHAVLVRKEFHAELQALSADLAIPLGEPSVVFAC